MIFQQGMSRDGPVLSIRDVAEPPTRVHGQVAMKGIGARQIKQLHPQRWDRAGNRPVTKSWL